MSQIEETHYMNGKQSIRIPCGDVVHVVHMGEPPLTVPADIKINVTNLGAAYEVRNPSTQDE